jgi:hypothetical protein
VTALRILFAFAWCAVLTACDSPRRELDAKALGTSAQQLESVAAEAGWLAQQLKVHSVTSGMAWVHQKALAEDAVKAAEGLGKAAPPRLRASQEQVATLAAHLQAKVMRIAPAADNAADLDALQREFRAIAAELHPLAERA